MLFLCHPAAVCFSVHSYHLSLNLASAVFTSKMAVQGDAFRKREKKSTWVVKSFFFPSKKRLSKRLAELFLESPSFYCSGADVIKSCTPLLAFCFLEATVKCREQSPFSEQPLVLTAFFLFCYQDFLFFCFCFFLLAPSDCRFSFLSRASGKLILCFFVAPPKLLQLISVLIQNLIKIME